MEEIDRGSGSYHDIAVPPGTTHIELDKEYGYDNDVSVSVVFKKEIIIPNEVYEKAMVQYYKDCEQYEKDLIKYKEYLPLKKKRKEAAAKANRRKMYNKLKLEFGD